MAKATEKRKPTTVQARKSLIYAGRAVAASKQMSYADWLEQVLIAAIPPAFRKNIDAR